MCQSHKQSEESKKFKSHTSLDSRRNTFSSNKYPSAWYTNTNTWYKNHNCRAWTDSDESGIWVKKKLTSWAAVQGCLGQRLHDHWGRLVELNLFHFSAKASAAIRNSLDERVPSQFKISNPSSIWDSESLNKMKATKGFHFLGWRRLCHILCWSIFTVLAVQKKYIFTMPYVVVNLHYDFSKQKPKIRGKRWRWGVYAFCV